MELKIYLFDRYSFEGIQIDGSGSLFQMDNLKAPII